MPFDRKDHAELVAKKNEARNREMLPAFRALAAAAPVMDRLNTGNEAWDRYLTILQGQVERITRLRDDACRRMRDPAVWGDEANRMLKAEAMRADAMLEVLDFVMNLPKALIEDGARAQEIVSQFEAKDDAQKPAS